jgi:hypothetical protein
MTVGSWLAHASADAGRMSGHEGSRAHCSPQCSTNLRVLRAYLEGGFGRHGAELLWAGGNRGGWGLTQGAHGEATSHRSIPVAAMT